MLSKIIWQATRRASPSKLAAFDNCDHWGTVNQWS